MGTSIKKLKVALPDLGISLFVALALFFASPGFDFWPLAVLAFAVLAYGFERGKIKPWKLSFLTGFIYITLAMNWVTVPVTLFGGAPMAAGIVIVIFIGLLGALLFWLPMGWAWSKTNSFFLAALVLVALELAKGRYFLGGVPWLNIAQTQYNNTLALQLVSVLGEQGLSLITVLLGFYLYKTLRTKDKYYISVTLALLVIFLGYGALRLATHKLPAPTTTARMLQTGVDQKDKWDRNKAGELLVSLTEGFKKAGEPGDYELLILPETSFNYNPFTTPYIRQELDDISARTAVLISADKRIPDGESYKLYNTLYLYKDGEILEQYDKMRLAPFGEYFPFEKQLYPIRRFFFGDGPLFSPGQRPVVMEYNELKIAPFICYEGIFPELMAERVKLGANVFVIVSNDSWFGSSIGRNQNLAMNMIRAVEFDRYVLRTTQDGISTLVDPYGHKVVVFPEKSYYFSDVVFSVRETTTLFSTLNYTWYPFLLIGYALYLVRKRCQKRLKG